MGGRLAWRGGAVQVCCCVGDRQVRRMRRDLQEEEEEGQSQRGREIKEEGIKRNGEIKDNTYLAG